MKNIIAAAILGISLIIAAVLHGGIYERTFVHGVPVLTNRVTGTTVWKVTIQEK